MKLQAESGEHSRQSRLTHDPTTPALPHDGGLQPQAEAAAAGAAPEEEVQAMGSDVAEGDGLGS